MFIQNLSPTQQGVLLWLVKRMIKADGIISEGEENMLAIIETQCDDNCIKVDNVEMSNLKTIYQTERAKSSLMLELLAVAYADGDYHESEQGLIEEVSKNIGFLKSKISDMENWVQRQLILTSESEIFMED